MQRNIMYRLPEPEKRTKRRQRIGRVGRFGQSQQGPDLSRSVELGNGSQVERGGMMMRFMARFVDFSVMLVLGPIVAAVFNVTLSGGGESYGNLSDASVYELVIFALSVIAGIVSVFLYEILLVTRRGKSWGKGVSNLKIVDFQSGDYPRFKQMLKRSLFLAIPYVNIAIFLSSNLYADRRGWHDRAAGTIVISTYHLNSDR